MYTFKEFFSMFKKTNKKLLKNTSNNVLKNFVEINNEYIKAGLKEIRSFLIKTIHFKNFKVYCFINSKAQQKLTWVSELCAVGPKIDSKQKNNFSKKN